MQKEAAAKVDELLTPIDVTDAVKKVQGEPGIGTGEEGDTAKVRSVPTGKFIPGP